MSEPKYDLLLKAGRVFCAVNGLDGPGAVAVKDGRIAAVGDEVVGEAQKVLEFPEDLLLPGLVDLHAHPARGGSKYGVDPDEHFLPRGVTTVMSQGDAGALQWSQYRKDVIEGSRIRVLLAINLAAPGESRPEQGCFEFLDDVDVEACAGAVEAERSGIWGIALNTAQVCCGDNDPVEILSRGLEAAERTGLPLLMGTRREAGHPLGGELERLRSGDVVTYCFHNEEESIALDGKVRDEVWAARQRGVLFDTGHGMTSFSFAVAEAAIAQGFLPDTISTDQYARHVGSVPQHDLPRTMAKLLAAGMDETEVLARATGRPAAVLGLEGEVGCMTPGACGDLTVLRWREDGQLVDVEGAGRPGGCWEAALTVRAGEIVETN